ncbi:hypothetical protein B0J17DRAFT_663374 [Rhizoctonia solani]|nr:hypothetical protein B0J17DRAFT_663374 [Rhizoctonia solani]
MTSRGDDHYYTLNGNDTNLRGFGYRDEGVVGLVFAKDQPELSLVGIYRYYNKDTNDHWFTKNYPEMESVANNKGYVLEDKNPSFYLFAHSMGCDTIPVYQWLNNTDHFLTTDGTGELAPMLQSGPGGRLEYQGIVGYVFPNTAEVKGTRAPLYRYYRPVR